MHVQHVFQAFCSWLANLLKPSFYSVLASQVHLLATICLVLSQQPGSCKKACGVFLPDQGCKKFWFLNLFLRVLLG